MNSIALGLAQQLRDRGYAHVTERLGRAGYRLLAQSAGNVLAEESIALRPGAHAYVAKPGPVPLHTDHPEVGIIGWLCEEQDDLDGASLILDAMPIIENLSEEERRMLYQVELWCPPLAGGPPTLKWPVLRSTGRGTAIFASPWLRSANAIGSHEAVLAEFRKALSAAARAESLSIRLGPGESLFVDNRRVLHGRRAIAENSRRRLHRVWIEDREP